MVYHEVVSGSYDAKVGTIYSSTGSTVGIMLNTFGACPGHLDSVFCFSFTAFLSVVNQDDHWRHGRLMRTIATELKTTD